MSKTVSSTNVVRPGDCAGRAECCELSSRMAAVLLFAGSVDRSALRTATGRLPVELPVSADRNALSLWRGQVTDFAAFLQRPELAVRAFVDQDAPPSLEVAAEGEHRVVIERDPQPYRGTAGLLRDAVADYQADEYVLMINAAQIPLAPLSQVFQRLCQTRADVAVASNRDGTPSGHMLVRCGVMAEVAASGFVDMKEQVLEQLAKHFAVGVADFEQPGGLPIRSRARYLAALRAWYRVQGGRQPVQGPFEEDWHAEFGFAEPGARVDSSAVLHDSVVLDGGTVEPDAVVIRSVVCRGAVIRRKQTVTGQLLADPARAKEASESA